MSIIDSVNGGPYQAPVNVSHHQVAPQSQASTSCSQVTLASSIPIGGDEIRPEIIFLIREHAKTLATINTLSARLTQLELKVNTISERLLGKKRDEKKRQSLHTPNTPTASSNQLKESAISDDSGGEYSRTISESNGGAGGNNGTVGGDDDELLSLLNQIVKYSNTINSTGRSTLSICSSGNKSTRLPRLQSRGEHDSFSALVMEPDSDRFIRNVNLTTDKRLRPNHMMTGSSVNDIGKSRYKCDIQSLPNPIFNGRISGGVASEKRDKTLSRFHHDNQRYFRTVNQLTSRLNSSSSSHLSSSSSSSLSSKKNATKLSAKKNVTKVI